MTVQELIDRLKKFPPDMEVMILDGHNGGGTPREVNLGPKSAKISAEDDEASADCEGRAGEAVIVIGFGCY